MSQQIFILQNFRLPGRLPGHLGYDDIELQIKRNKSMFYMSTFKCRICKNRCFCCHNKNMLIVHFHIYMYLVCVNHMRFKHMELEVLVDRTQHPPLFTPYPFFFFFSFHFHGLEICKTAIICRFLIA